MVNPHLIITNYHCTIISHVYAMINRITSHDWPTWFTSLYQSLRTVTEKTCQFSARGVLQQHSAYWAASMFGEFAPQLQRAPGAAAPVVVNIFATFLGRKPHRLDRIEFGEVLIQLIVHVVLCQF